MKRPLPTGEAVFYLFSGLRLSTGHSTVIDRTREARGESYPASLVAATTQAQCSDPHAEHTLLSWAPSQVEHLSNRRGARRNRGNSAGIDLILNSRGHTTPSATRKRPPASRSRAIGPQGSQAGANWLHSGWAAEQNYRQKKATPESNSRIRPMKGAYRSTASSDAVSFRFLPFPRDLAAVIRRMGPATNTCANPRDPPGELPK